MSATESAQQKSRASQDDQNHDVQYPLLPVDFKTEWTSLTIPLKNIKRTGWYARAMPDELSALPEDIVIPEKLQQVLNWSVTAGSSWAVPPAQSEDQVDAESAEDVVVDLQQSQDVPSRQASVKSNAMLKPLDAQSIRSLRSQTVISDTASVKFAAEKSAWKAKFFNKISRKRPLIRTLAPPPRPPTPTAECIVCFEEIPIPELLCMEACRHYYCKDCLSRHIVVAMSSESAFPPKCCLNAIPLHTILLSLDADQREEYQSKSAEYALAPTERWYCPRTDCAKWIPPSRLVLDRATTNYTCPFCSGGICRTCRGDAHAAGTECPQDFGLEQTLEVAESEGWQRCYNCQALVEHTYGCRHMTCKCRAEFCYVCGVRWQTCNCTEADAENRRTDVNRRREERIAAAEAELAEIARAIAEVEAMERAEAEARRLREEQRAREEEEQLAALEAQRLEEEAARLAAEEEAERQWYEVIRASFEEDFRKLQSTLIKILSYQHAAIISRHKDIDTALGTDLDGLADRIEQQFQEKIAKVNAMYAGKRVIIKSKHAEEVETLENQQEEDEDDLVVQNTMRLRGKANKESRMERMLAELRKQHEEAREEVVKTHTHDLYILEVRKNIDLTGINAMKVIEVEFSQHKLEERQREFGTTVGADRKYFEMVTKRRLNMLELHREIALEEISQRQEPTGIQDYHAAACDPVLPDLAAEEYEGLTGTLGARRLTNGSLSQGLPQIISLPGVKEETIPTVIETSDLYGAGEHISAPNLGQQSASRSLPREDAFLQPMPPPDRRPPTPPSSAVSIEAPHARRVTAETIQRLEDSSHVTAYGGSGSESYMTVPSSRNRQSSVSGSTISADSREHRPSISSTTKKGRSWFGRKKELSEEEIRHRMKNFTVGDAF